jgi:RNA polymerase sigma factor (sigma-70 family)
MRPDIPCPGGGELHRSDVRSGEPEPDGGGSCITLAFLRPARDFSAVYDEHVWQVYGFFAYRLRTRADAEDLTQQTFERALKAWSRYDASKASVGTWLIVIARNLLVDHFRADRSSRQQSLDELDSGHDALTAHADAPDLGLAPDLERALGSLGARDREIIALRFGGELTGPEIAETTGLSLANVQQILSRSLRRMRDVLDAEQGVEAPDPQPPG